MIVHGGVPASPWRVAAVAGAAALAAALVGQLVDTGAEPGGPVAPTAAIAVAFTVLGALVRVTEPAHLVGRLMLAAGAVACVAVLAVSWTGWLPLAWLSKWAWWPPYGLIALSLLVFPDGRLPSRRWRPVAIAIAAATAVATVALAAAAADHPRTLLTTIDAPLTDRAQLLVRIAAAAIVVVAAGLVAVLCSLAVRWRRADGETRHQLMCLLPAAILLLLALVLDTFSVDGAWLVAVAAVPLGMTVAVLRYHLYDLDQIVNRTVVWLVMTLLVVVGFVAIVQLLRDVVMAGDTENASLVATGLVAVTFEPLHRRVQHGVNRVLYGDRDDPYKVIARLSDLLGRTGEPAAVLPSLTGTIARSLQVPYVGLEVEGRGGPRVIAEHGRTHTPVEAFDMVAHGQRVGRLLVAPRSPGSRFTSRESRLLQDVALHAAVAAEATRLVRDLQESRERLVMAREEERRRLRRDLHDGLGPSLAGMAMEIRAARKLVTGQQRAGEILDALAEDLQQCTSEVRQLVDELRPPTLDRGLAEALRAECRRFTSSSLSVHLQVAESLDGLPAALEVAVYRIVAEALTNVARHARASTCRVTVRRNHTLDVRIVDDGAGIGTPVRLGVGLRSMRERAAELGGDCEVGPADPCGTAIRVRLPIASGATTTPAVGQRA